MTGRGVNSPHRISEPQDDLEGVHHVSMDYRFLGERDSEEQVTSVLVTRERRLKMTWRCWLQEQDGIFLD